MARWSKSDKARIELRRVKVEQLAGRGLGLYEITEALVQNDILNPDTEKPYSVATISRDLAEIEERLFQETIAECAKNRAKQVGELRTARRAAWEKGDYAEVRRNLETEAKLLGTEAPSRHEHTGKDEEPIIITVGGLDLEHGI